MRRMSMVVALALSLALGACGGHGESAQSKYAKAINADVQAVGAQLIASSQAVNSSSDDTADRAALGEQASELRALANKIAAVKAPKGMETQNAALASAVTNYASSVETAANGGDVAALVADTKLAAGRIKATVAQINGGMS